MTHDEASAENSVTDDAQSAPQKDVLLITGKIMTVLMQAVTGLALAALIAMLAAIWFHTSKVSEGLAQSDIALSLPMAMVMISATIIGSVVIVAAAYYFFRLLMQIIDTVRQGDPFAIINAQRLSRMGWITLIFQIASLPIGIGAAISAELFLDVDVKPDIEFSLTGVLLAIVLFILARVFRHGAAMRDELEGTI